MLVPRRRRFGVIERIGPAGEVLTALDHASLDAAIDKVAASGASVCAIALLNGFTNPAHEIAIRERLRQRLPRSRRLLLARGLARDPRIRADLDDRAQRAADPGGAALYRRAAGAHRGGGAERAALSRPVEWRRDHARARPSEAPVKLLLSGPSGGVLAAESVARQLGFPNVVGVDMGGTSYDVAVIRDGARAVVTQGDVDGLPVRVPMVDMRTIGAGGGSIASLDASGRLQVGPRSAGAKPGPVCYGRGGTEPTVTDVNLILGRLDPVTFLGGDVRARSRRRARGARPAHRRAARARSRPRRGRHPRRRRRQARRRDQALAVRARARSARFRADVLRRRRRSPCHRGRRRTRHDHGDLPEGSLDLLGPWHPAIRHRP